MNSSFIFKLVMAFLALWTSAGVAGGGKPPGRVEPPKIPLKEDKTVSPKNQSSATPGVNSPTEAKEQTTSHSKPKSSSEVAAIQATVGRYRDAKAVSMAVKKRVVQSLLGKEKVSRGKLYYSKGRLRMEISEPDSSLLVLDGQAIWVVNQLPKELGGKLQVAKVPTTGPRRSNAILAFFFQDAQVWEDLNLVTAQEKGDLANYVFTPKNFEKFPGITKIQIVINMKKKEILGLSYWDDIENETSFAFANISFGAQISSKKFSYVPPKNAEVTIY